MYHLQKVDNCLKFMCDVIKVHTFPTCPESWIITDEMEEIEINSIGDIVSAAINIQINKWPNSPFDSRGLCLFPAACTLLTHQSVCIYM